MLITIFICYLAIVLGIGIITARMNKNLEDFLIAGRRLPIIATAISDKASDMSGWLVMGLPGQVFSNGIGALWAAIGCTAGTFFNWAFVALRFRQYSGKLRTMTVTGFLESRFKDTTNAIRVICTVIILVYMTYYVNAQFVTGAKAIETTMHLSYDIALYITAGIIIVYTLFGGFFAVAWTDVVQGLLMVTILCVLPVIGFMNLGGVSTALQTIQQNNPVLLDPMGGKVGLGAIIFAISYLSWIVGYPGQPHIITRYMAVDDPKKLIRPGIFISMIWVIISLWGAVALGLVAFAKYGVTNPLLNQDPERVIPILCLDLLPPIIGGIFLSGLIAAVMSTADSQLLVASSAVSEDIINKFFGKKLSNQGLLWVGRICVVFIGLIAFMMARSGGSIYWLVVSAWGGLAAGFGPPIILSLWWKRTTRAGVIAGLIVGPTFNLIGSLLKWETIYFGGIPTFLIAFVLSFILIILVSLFTRPPVEVEEEFKELDFQSAMFKEEIKSKTPVEAIEFSLQVMPVNQLLHEVE